METPAPLETIGFADLAHHAQTIVAHKSCEFAQYRKLWYNWWHE